MSDITDIVSRLRRTDENRGVPICSEAADTIERLRKERNETNASLDALLLMRAAQAHGFDCCKEDGK